VNFRRNGGPPLLQLVRDVNADAQRLACTQIELVRARFAEAVRHAETGAGLLLEAAVVALFAFAAFLATAGLALSLVLPGWASALIVGIVLVLVGAALGAAGRQQLEAASSARTSGPADIERDLADTRYRLEAELEAISARIDPRHRSLGADGAGARRADGFADRIERA